MASQLPEVVVVGSCNMDLIAYAARLPLPGETVHGHRYVTGFGGKGANQCVAAAKLGAGTALIAKLGDDGHGADYLQHLRALGVDTQFVSKTAAAPSGVAPITVANDGTNSIVIVSGANMMLSATDVDSAISHFRSAKVVLCQLEVPGDVTLHALKLAKTAGRATTIFNPAPAPTEQLHPDLYANADIVCPNETEASMMTGIEVRDVGSAGSAAAALVDKGCEVAVVTLGGDGCVFVERGGGPVHVAGQPVDAVVDTTGAGDAFAGALAYFIAAFPDLELREKLRRACCVAGASVRREGTQKSFPLKSELPANLFFS